MNQKNKYKDPDNYTINHHKTGYLCSEWALSRKKSYLEKTLNRGLESPVIFEALVVKILELANEISYSEQDASYLKITLEFLGELYDLAKESEEKGIEEKVIHIEGVGDFTAKYPQRRYPKVAGAYLWMKAMSLAIIFKDELKIQKFCDFPESLINCLPFRNIMVEIWKKLLKGEVVATSEYEMAHKHIEDRINRESPKSMITSYHQCFDVPMLELLIALASKDKETINDKLAEVFRGHRSYYDRKKKRNRGDALYLNEEFEGCFPLIQIGLYYLSNRVFPNHITVTSEYIPEWIGK